MSSFPVPVSPSMRTVESVEATCSTWSRTDSRAAQLPTIDSNLRSGGSASGCVTVAYSSTRNLLSRDAIVVAVSFTDQVLLGPFRATGDDPPVSPGTRLRPLSSLESASFRINEVPENVDCRRIHGVFPTTIQTTNYDVRCDFRVFWQSPRSCEFL